VLVVDVMDVTLANCGVFMLRHTHDVEVTLVQYRGPMGSHPPPAMVQLAHNLHKCCFNLQDLWYQFIFEATIIYHYEMFPILQWGCFGLGHFFHIFVTYVIHVFYLRHFFSFYIIIINKFSHLLICMFFEIIKKLIFILHSNQKTFLYPQNKKFKLKNESNILMKVFM
jgi:hypothetical protein